MNINTFFDLKKNTGCRLLFLLVPKTFLQSEFINVKKAVRAIINVILRNIYALALDSDKLSPLNNRKGRYAVFN